MKCPFCDNEMVHTIENYQYIESGLDNVFLKGVDFFRCESCDEEIVSLPNIIQLQNLIGRLLIKRDSPLNGNEIKFLRKNIGLSAKIFAEYLGINKATFSRWEHNSQEPSKTHDRLIRMVYLSIKGIKDINEIKNLVEKDFVHINKRRKKTNLVIPPEFWSKNNSC